MTTGHRSFIYGTQRAERIAIREAEVMRESRFLGVEPRFLRLPFYDANYEISERDLEIFGSLLTTFAPDWIFMPHQKDSHPAHMATRTVVKEALKRHLAGTSRTMECWLYEGPWALFNRGEFNAIVTVPGISFERKLQAIARTDAVRACTGVGVGRIRGATSPSRRVAGAFLPGKRARGIGGIVAKRQRWTKKPGQGRAFCRLERHRGMVGPTRPGWPLPGNRSPRPAPPFPYSPEPRE